MALKWIHYVGTFVPDAYTRLEGRVKKEYVVTQQSVAATVDEEGNETSPAIPEVIEYLPLITIVSFIWMHEVHANSKNPTLVNPAVEGKVLYKGGDVLAEAYEYAKTLERFDGSVDV